MSTPAPASGRCCSMEGTTPAELVAHFVCFLFTLLGTLLAGIKADSSDFLGKGEIHDIVFVFVIASVLSFSLFLNAGRQIIAMLPASIALGYFWFPRGIEIADRFSERLKVDGLPKDAKTDFQFILAGAIFSLFGTFLGVVVEAVFVKKSRFPGVKPVQMFAFLGAFTTLAGAIGVWSRRRADTAVGDEALSLSIQGLIGGVFALDSCLNPDSNLLLVIMFVVVFSGCECIDSGILFQDAGGDKRVRDTLIGLLVEGIGLGILAASVAVTNASANLATKVAK
eukprot:c22148_g1_i1.p1 GENE.c22148_g1_i1~~c22148_g1_i1.p1  ORF type:complete len:299 (+),score=77.41 c22148_g1_i1:52-897(+)